MSLIGAACSVDASPPTPVAHEAIEEDATSTAFHSLPAPKLVPEAAIEENLDASGPARLVFRVELSGGPRAPGATVHLLDGSSHDGQVAIADATGQAVFDDLAQTTYQVWASSSGVASDLLTVEAQSERTEETETRIVLNPASVISGRLSTHHNLGVQGDVFLVPKSHDHVVMKTASDESGEFVFESLPHGEWEIQIAAEAHALASPPIIRATEATQHVSISMVDMASVTGTVVDDTGQAVEGAAIRIVPMSGRQMPRAYNSPIATHRPRWVHPLTGRRQLPLRDSRRFGAHRGGVRPAECGGGHCGVDLGSARGAAVVAAADGVVQIASDQDRGKAGRYVSIEHSSGLKTYYMHLDSIAPEVESGAPIVAGTLLGTLGRSGIRHSAPHLHFALAKEHANGSEFLDPEGLLRVAVVLAAPRNETPASRIVAPVLSWTADAHPFTMEREGEHSDESGHFATRALAPGDYMVTAVHPDLAPGKPHKITLRPGQRLTDVKIPLVDGARIRGRVFGPQGPVPGTWVRAFQGHGESRRQVAGADIDDYGAFSLRPLLGVVELEFGAAGFGILRTTVDASATTSGDHVFSLAPFDSEVRGQVRSPTGTAVSGAIIQIVSGPAGRGRKATSDEYGFFRFENLPRGKYEVRIRSGLYPEREVAIDDSDDAEVQLESGGSVHLDIRDDHSDAPVMGARVLLRGPGGSTRTVLSDTTGQIQVNALEPGRWTMRVDQTEYSIVEASFQVEAGDEAPSTRTIRLLRGAQLSGTVRDQHGDRVAGARVWLGASETTTNADGDFLLQRAMSGEVALRAKSRDGEAVLPLSLYPGDEETRIELTLVAPQVMSAQPIDSDP